MIPSSSSDVMVQSISISLFDVPASAVGDGGLDPESLLSLISMSSLSAAAGAAPSPDSGGSGGAGRGGLLESSNPGRGGGALNGGGGS